MAEFPTKIKVSIDVPSDVGLKFFSEVFGFIKSSRPHSGYAVLSAGEVTLGMIAKPAGSTPATGSQDVRKYEQHWTRGHADFHVQDFHATLKRALAAEAKSEQVLIGRVNCNS